MFDRSMPNVHLEMSCGTLAQAALCQPPAPYRLRSYRLGEEREWARIETNAGEFPCVEDGIKGFNRYFKTDAMLLPGRMLFLVDENDTPVATATAWFSGDLGMLHWVAVDAAHQGKGLARPIISAALARLREIGYSEARLGTQPPSWVAIRLYLEFGFRPVPVADEAALAGWQAVYAKLGKEFAWNLCAEQV